MPSTSVWTDKSLPAFPRPTRDLVVDTLVIGGGIMGVTAAYLLTKAGKRVALVEREKLASVDTGHTTAHLTYVTDRRISELSRDFRHDEMKLAWKAGEIAINQIKKNIDECGIDCDFEEVPGFLYLWKDANADEVDRLRKDAHLAERMGFAVNFVDRVPFFGTPGIRFEKQARFHPTKYLTGLLLELRNEGCAIFEEAEAKEFSDDPRAVQVDDHRIQASDVVIATHSPMVGNSSTIGAALFQTKLSLYTSYAVGASVPKGTIPDGLFWDTRDPYGYLRINSGESSDYLVYGGKDHKTGQVDDTYAIFQELERELREIVPNALPNRRWSGQVIETVDGLPYIGMTAPHQFSGTGFSGNGMTFGTIGAMMARDFVLGLSNPWKEIFSPGRKTISAALEYVKENVDYPYYLAKDRISSPAEEGSIEDVVRGEGKLLKVDGQTLAVYRDDSGTVHKLSPVCTHMSCIVRWNSAEKSWDCPCHGSRFSGEGEVLSGPAGSPLKVLND